MPDYDIYEGAFTGPQIDDKLRNSTRQDAIAIVSDNNTHIAITAGQYVYVKNHGTLSEGMYKANSNLNANATLTTSNMTAVSNGVANELKSAIRSLIVSESYSATYSIDANGYVAITASDLGITSKTGYSLLGCAAYALGNSNIFISRISLETSGTVLELRNSKSTAYSDLTCAITLLWKKS